MHILVTDRLVCPRCGPSFGLILLADELRDRRVISGSLGCPNCRETYPIRDGFADLRPSPRPRLHPDEPPAREDPEAAMRLAALVGVQEGPGLVLVAGAAAGHAARIAELVPEIEVIAVHPDLQAVGESDGVSRMAVAAPLPFQSGSLRGAVLEGGASGALLSETLRSLAPGARLVCLGIGDDTAGEIRARGGEVLLQSETALVGVKQ
jgi:uncharacterized protein YbaR (Trm112 family)